MKLKFISLLAAFVLVVSCHSYKTSTSSNMAYSVPDATRTAFLTQYPAAINATWSPYDEAVFPIDWELSGWPALDKSDYAVRFNLDNEDYYAWYDANGNWIGTTYLITDYKTLPVAVSTMITNDYPNYSLYTVNRVMQKDRMAYQIQLKNGDARIKMLVDENGNIIKKKEKMK